MKTLADGYGFSLMGNYLQSSYHTIWATAVGGVVANAMEAFFYPYVVFHAVGLNEWCRHNVIQHEYRYVTLGTILFIAPVGGAFHPVLGDDLSFIISLYFQPVESPLSVYNAYFILLPEFTVDRGKKSCYPGGGISRSGVPCEESAKDQEADKAVYADIGNTIAELDHSRNCIAIATRSSTPQAWITFLRHRS